MSANKFTEAKAAQAYVGAADRQRCETCRHCTEVYGASQQCRIGGFLVTRFGHCQRWEAKPRPSFKPPPI